MTLSLLPTREIRFLGFTLNTLTQTLSHTPQRVRSLADTLQLLQTPQPRTHYLKLAGLWCFYFSLYRAGYHALRPLFDAAQTGQPPPPQWCVEFRTIWNKLPHAVPLVPPPPVHTMYADASSTGLGVVTPSAALAIITHPSRKFFLREALAWLLAALLAPPSTLMHTDDLALRKGITAGHIGSLPWELCVAFSFVTIKDNLRARWIPTDLNPADMPSRLPHTFRPFASAIG